MVSTFAVLHVLPQRFCNLIPNAVRVVRVQVFGGGPFQDRPHSLSHTADRFWLGLPDGGQDCQYFGFSYSVNLTIADPVKSVVAQCVDPLIPVFRVLLMHSFLLVIIASALFK